MVCNDPRLALKDLSYTEYNSEYYNFKLSAIKSSLPNNLLETKQWKEFQGLDRPHVYNAGFGYVIDKVRERNKTICHIAHFNNELSLIKEKYSTAPVCKLLNFERFNSLCYPLKSGNDDLDRHSQGFKVWVETANSHDITVDIDGIMYNPLQFIIEMEKLYSYFELPDFNPFLLTEFYNQYRYLHGLV